MATSTRGLGKGLSALISENYTEPSSKAASKEAPGNITTLATAELHASPYQPRTRFDEMAMAELCESVERHGIMQPIIVRPSTQKGKHEIIAGERRWRAARMVGLQHVPVIVRDITDSQALEFALIENIQRQDLSPLEEAAGYQRLIQEFNYTQEQLGNIVGKSRSHITNFLRLLALPPEIKEMLEKGELTMGHARALLTAENAVEIARKIVEKGWTVRQAERFAAGAGPTKPRLTGITPPSRRGGPAIIKDPDILALEESLSENLGLKVSINDRGQSGEIVLAYDSLSQLDEILRKLGSDADGQV